MYTVRLTDVDYNHSQTLRFGVWSDAYAVAVKMKNLPTVFAHVEIETNRGRVLRSWRKSMLGGLRSESQATIAENRASYSFMAQEHVRRVNRAL